jgi:hypothetical protein
MMGGIKLLGGPKKSLYKLSRGLFIVVLFMLLNIAAVEAQTAQTEYQVIKMPDGGLVKAKLVNVSWVERNTALGGWSKIWRSSADPDQLVVYEWQGNYIRADWTSLNPRSQYTGRDLKLVEVLTPQEAAKYPIADVPIWHSGKEYYPESVVNIPVIGPITTKPAEVKATPATPATTATPEQTGEITYTLSDGTTITNITGIENPAFIPLAPAQIEKEGGPITAAPAAAPESAINTMAIALSAMFIVLVGLVVWLLTKQNLYIALLICVVMSFMAALPYLV